MNNPVLSFLTCEDLVSLSQAEAKFNKKMLYQKIYKEQIQQHDEFVTSINMGNNNICHVMAAENLLSLKQLEHPLEDPLECEEVQEGIDASTVAMIGLV